MQQVHFCGPLRQNQIAGRSKTAELELVSGREGHDDMVVLNYTGGEINAKIVYYGPGVGGKTTNLEYIHEKTPAAAKGKMVSMKTQTDRTLFFDFLPLELGDINGFRTRFLLYTVPGQVYYNATRKLVLKGADAIVFVADSSRAKLAENLESLRNLEHNLNEHGMTLDEIPWVIQYNKRDLPDAMPIEELDVHLNPLGVATFEAVANTGAGVYDTLHGIATRVYSVLKDRLDQEETAPTAPAPAAPRGAETASSPAETRSRAAKPAPAAPRSPRPAPPPVQPPAPETEVQVEHDVDHVVDFALRETEETPAAHRPARRGATPRASKVAAPSPAKPSAPDAADGNDLFEAIPETAFDSELGRLPSLEEAAAASESVRHEGPDEFVTDPMRHSPQREPAKKTAPALMKSVFSRLTPAPKAPPAPPRPAPPVPTPSAPVPAAPAPPAPVPTTAAAPEPAPRTAIAIPVVEEVRVPVTVTREQIARASSLRITLELEIEDE